MAEPSLAESRFNFLTTDLDLANTFVQLAETELGLRNREHCDALLGKAQIAVDTVRRLMDGAPKMESDQRKILTDRCDGAESAIRRLEAKRSRKL